MHVMISACRPANPSARRGAPAEVSGPSVFGYRRPVCDGVRLPQNGQEVPGSDLNCSEIARPVNPLG